MGSTKKKSAGTGTINGVTVSYTRDSGGNVSYHIGGNTYSSVGAASAALSGASSSSSSSSSSKSSGGGGGGSSSSSSGGSEFGYAFGDQGLLGSQGKYPNYENQGAGNYTYNADTGYYENTSNSSSVGSSITRSTPTLTSTGMKNVVQSPYANQGAGSYSYSPVTGYYEKVSNKSSPANFYGEDENHYGILNNRDKLDPETTYKWEGAKLMDSLTNPAIQNQNVADAKVDLTGGEKNQNMNTFGSFVSAVNNKLQTAYGIQDLNALKEKYPDQYSSVMQALSSVAPVWNSLDPSQRNLLEGQLQAILGTAVGAGADKSKLDVLNQSIMDKFQNGQQVAKDMQDIVRLQTEGLSTKEIAKQMGVSEDQVQQAILAYNGLDNRLGEYYKLKSSEANEITEPYDTKMERLAKEKEIALDRANRQIERMKQDFDTNMARQKQVNEINAHNADFMSGQYGFGFSKRGIEGLNYVQDQAQQIIDDMVKNYDRNNIEMAEGVTDIIRNWEWNNEDLMKASEDALNAAKNNYTSNMLAIQQQYGTVGMQAQQQLANNVQAFITQAENIYDNALNRQQQNLTNLITNFSNLNALSYSNLTLRNAKIQQFQAESMNMNRNQLQQLAQQLGMSSAEYGDLANYQVQAVANELNGYKPGAGMQFQGAIQGLLNQGYTPNEAMSVIMNSPEWQAIQGTASEWTKLNDNTIFDKNSGQYINIQPNGGMSGANGTNYVSSQTVDGQVYGVSEKTYTGLQSFKNQYPQGSTGGQCGAFANKYLQSLGLAGVFDDPIDKKKAVINTPDGYKPQVGDIAVMNTPNVESQKRGHVAIITAVNPDGSFVTLESNRKNNDGKVFSRTITPNSGGAANEVFGYYHPDGVTGQGGNEQGYDPALSQYYDKWFDMTKDDRARVLKDEGLTDKQISQQMTNYFNDKEKTEAVETITKLRDTAQQLLDWNKKESSSGAGSLHEGRADLETFNEGQYHWEYEPLRGVFGKITGEGVTKASEGAMLYHFLKDNQSLDKFVQARSNGVTFGSMTEGEWKLVGGAASKLDWKMKDADFEKYLQEMIDLYDEKLNKINGGNAGGGRGLQGTIQLDGRGRS